MNLGKFQPLKSRLPKPSTKTFSGYLPKLPIRQVMQECSPLHLKTMLSIIPKPIGDGTPSTRISSSLTADSAIGFLSRNLRLEVLFIITSSLNCLRISEPVLTSVQFSPSNPEKDPTIHQHHLFFEPSGKISGRQLKATISEGVTYLRSERHPSRPRGIWLSICPRDSLIVRQPLKELVCGDVLLGGREIPLNDLMSTVDLPSLGLV